MIRKIDPSELVDGLYVQCIDIIQSASGELVAVDCIYKIIIKDGNMYYQTPSGSLMDAHLVTSIWCETPTTKRLNRNVKINKILQCV